MIDKIVSYGHKNISGNHRTTIEITKDNFLTKGGSCIIGIKSNKSCDDVSLEVKKDLISGKSIRIILEVDGKQDEIIAKGSPHLTLKDKNSIVIRKSGYIDNRTLAIYANKSSVDIDRDIIKKLKNNGQKMILTIEVLENEKK